MTLTLGKEDVRLRWMGITRFNNQTAEAKKWYLHFQDILFLKMFVQLYNLHVENLFKVLKYVFFIFVKRKVHFNFICLRLFIMNQPVKIQIKLMEMLVFENFTSLWIHTHNEEG